MGLPIGQRESEVLEFKGRDALSDRKELGREVVAFLNTQGGDLYIGIREENEIAVEVEPIADAEEEVRKLRDSLHDSIEPSPSPGELTLTVEQAEEGQSLLRIRVRKGAHGPYALGSVGARRFMVRVLDSSRPMSREELAARFTEGAREEDRLLSVREQLQHERDELLREGEDQVWCAIQPVADVELKTSDPALAALLTDPEAIGSSPGSPSFHVPFEPEVRQDRLVVEVPDFGPRLKETVLRNDGGIRFHAVLQVLYQHSRGSTPRVINPEVLIGVPLSLLRLAAAVLVDRVREDDTLIVDLALLGVGREGAILFPGRWEVPRPGQQARSFEDGDDLMLTRPPVFTFAEVRDNPERCTFRLLSPIYEAFGLRENAIPIALDPRTGRLKTPG